MSDRKCGACSKTCDVGVPCWWCGAKDDGPSDVTPTVHDPMLSHRDGVALPEKDESTYALNAQGILVAKVAQKLLEPVEAASTRSNSYAFELGGDGKPTPLEFSQVLQDVEALRARREAEVERSAAVRAAVIAAITRSQASTWRFGSKAPSYVKLYSNVGLVIDGQLQAEVQRIDVCQSLKGARLYVRWAIPKEGLEFDGAAAIHNGTSHLVTVFAGDSAPPYRGEMKVAHFAVGKSVGGWAVARAIFVEPFSQFLSYEYTYWRDDSENGSGGNDGRPVDTVTKGYAGFSPGVGGGGGNAGGRNGNT